MTALFCPMHPKPHPQCNEAGQCFVCGRSWSVDDEGNMMSAKRAVKIVGEIKPGADINDVIQPLNNQQSH